MSPNLDQHMAHEVNRNGNYYCLQLGAACDFRIMDLPSDELVKWIVAQQLPFDSVYFYGVERPIHISYGPGRLQKKGNPGAIERAEVQTTAQQPPF